MDITRRISLEETELFGSLSAARLARVRALLQLRSFEAGEYLYMEGLPAEYLWMVRAGEIRTLKTSANGRVMALERFLPGEVFGMATIMRRDRYTESAQGVVSGEVWRTPRRALAELAREEPQLSNEILAIVTRRLQDAHDRLCSIAHDSVATRLARTVLESADDDRLQMTRRTLGEFVGTTVETAIRVLRRFERQGWIEGRVGAIQILDRGALASIAEGRPVEGSPSAPKPRSRRAAAAARRKGEPPASTASM